MAAETSDSSVTLELHGALADRLAALGRKRGTRTLLDISITGSPSVAALLTNLVDNDPRFDFLFDRGTQSLPEHVEVVLNDRVLDLQGGVSAQLQPGDVLTFVPAHAGG